MNSFRIFPALLLGGLVVGCGDDVTRVVNQGGGDTGGATDPRVFNFRTDPLAAYNQAVTISGVSRNLGKIDRMGGPATTTALLQPGAAGGNVRQVFNETEPRDDAQFATEYTMQLQRFHFHLAPFFMSAGIPTCGVAGPSVAATNVSRCVTQALLNPVIPDVLRLDTTRASDYPNGRKPDDQVVDILLAIALLDLGADDGTPGNCLGSPCSTRTFADFASGPDNPGGGLNVHVSSPPSLPTFPYLNNVALNNPPPADP